MAASEFTTSVVIDTDLPYFDGHFPDMPILPGIIQLKMITDLIARKEGLCLCLTGVKRVKFRKLTAPGDRLDISVSCEERASKYNFNITNSGEAVCSGILFFTLKATQ